MRKLAEPLERSALPRSTERANRRGPGTSEGRLSPIIMISASRIDTGTGHRQRQRQRQQQRQRQRHRHRQQQGRYVAGQVAKTLAMASCSAGVTHRSYAALTET